MCKYTNQFICELFSKDWDYLLHVFFLEDWSKISISNEANLKLKR